MTLEEAIQHLRESIADPTHEWGCEECKQEHEQLLAFLQELKKYRETFGNVKNTKFCIPECKEGCEKLVEQYERKNAELKRLLMLAMDSIQVMSRADGCVACSQCNYEAPIGEDENGDFITSPHCDKSDCFEWEHHDEAMKLLGGTENAEDRTA